MAYSGTIDTTNSLAGDSLDLVKEFLSISGSGTNDILALYINAASEFCNYYCGAGASPRLLRARAITEYYSGDGSNAILPRQYPINSITSLHDDIDRVYGSDTELYADGDIIIENDNTRIRYYGGSFAHGMNNIKLIYNAGYSTIPAVLQLACLEIVRFFYQDSEEKRAGITTRSMADGSLGIMESRIPKDTLLKLEPYGRKW